jgi:hypothetical protein
MLLLLLCYVFFVTLSILIVMFSLVYSFIQPATVVALDMSIQSLGKEYIQLITYVHLAITKTKSMTIEIEL